MRGDLKVRKVRTGSGSIAVQIVRYVDRKCLVIEHMGSAREEEALKILMIEAESRREALCDQPSLFSIKEEKGSLLHKDYLSLGDVTHLFAHKMLRRSAALCGIGKMQDLYQDLALMRIIEPTSKLKTIELLKRYFKISYGERSVYRLLPKLVEQKDEIEAAAYETACTHLKESFALVLYDVTTLYFESHKPDDDLQARGFSKDDKSKQPQVVIGLLVTHQGFPIMQEVFKGNTFEGHTMLRILEAFKVKHPQVCPVIVADAAMLSQANMAYLDEKGYRYIVGARLANAPLSFIDHIHSLLSKKDSFNIRLSYPKRTYDVVCSYSEKRARKDRRDLEKHLEKAKDLIERKECGKRAKFIKKSPLRSDAFSLNEELKEKAEKLLGIKGYITNIQKNTLSNAKIIDYYHELWHVEQAFRVSKSDLKARPIFHHSHQAIKAHVLICFMALMMAKFLEIKTGLSIKKIRDILWRVHEVSIRDSLSKKNFTLQSNLDDFHNSPLSNLLLSH